MHVLFRYGHTRTTHSRQVQLANTRVIRSGRWASFERLFPFVGVLLAEACGAANDALGIPSATAPGSLLDAHLLRQTPLTSSGSVFSVHQVCSN